MKTRSKELEDLFETAKILEDYFLSELILTDAHISNITGGKFGSKFGLSLKYKQCIEMVYLENTVLDLVLNLLSELGESLRSMLIGNYGSVSRSLRWIVEYTIFWVYMQNDRKESAKHRFERYYEESMTKRYFNYLSTQVFDINACKLEERLHFKEEYGRPTFDDMRKSLSMFDNAPKEIQEIPEKIKKLYHEFSSMIHVSLNSLDQLRMSGRFPVFMDYYYEKETFDSTIEKIWKAIDLITAIIIMESSIFYGYKKPSDYLVSTKSYYEKHPIYLKQSTTKKLINHISKKRTTQLPVFLSLISEKKVKASIDAAEFKPNRLCRNQASF